MGDVSCCLRCHFEWEESHAFGDLPPELAARLRLEHDELKAADYPRERVRDHAEREMLWFRWYCSPEVVAFLERDHEAYSRGEMEVDD